MNEKIMAFVKYLHHHPHCGATEAIRELKISDAGFYRHRNEAERIFKMSIRVGAKPDTGYYIEDYGLIDKEKL